MTMEKRDPLDDETLEAGLRLAYRQDALGSVPRITTRPAIAIGGARLVSGPVPGDRRFEVVREVARGGMGTVLEVFDHDLGRRVAVKVLRDHLRTRESAHGRLLTEAQVAGQLRHPGVPAVHDVSLAPDGSPSIVMELVDGESLAARLARRTDPAADHADLLRTFTDLARIVAHAHDKGVVHRDIKPANVMIGAFGEVLLMDWGVARILGGGREPDRTLDSEESGATRDGAVVGSPGYMAPEQLRGDSRHATPASDVFALGVILVEILLGSETLFDDGDLAPLDAVQRVLRERVAESRLREIVRKAIAERPEDRYADAGELHAELLDRERQLEQRAAAAERERSIAEGRAVAERRLRRYTVVGTLLLVSVVAIAAAVWRVTDLRRQRLEAAQRKAVLEACDVARDALEAARISGDVAAWQEALTAVERAHSSYEQGAASDLGVRIAELAARARAGHRAAADAERHRLERRTLAAALEELVFHDGLELASRTFADYVGDPGSTSPSVLAERVAARGFGPEFAEWIDLWAMQVEQPVAGHLLALADEIDPDETRQRIRAHWDDPEVLSEIARELEVEAHSPHTIRLLVRDQVGRSGALVVAGPHQCSGDLELAEDLLQAALTAHPDSAALHWEGARLHLREHAISNDGSTLDPALSHAIAFQGLQPDLPFGWRLRALVLLHMRRAHEALRWARRFAVARPADPGARTLLATALTRDGRHEEAAQQIAEALRASPRDPDALVTRAEVEENLGNTAASLEALAMAAERAENPLHILLHGLRLEQAGEVAAAIDWLERAVQRWPNTLATRYELGRLLKAAGRIDAMREQAEHLAGLGHHAREVHGSLITSAAAYRMSLELDPGTGNNGTAILATLVHAALGRYDELLEFWRDLCIASDDPQAWFAFGDALRQAGHREPAADAFRRALLAESPPFFHFAYYGFALIELGRFERARSAYESAVRAHRDPGFMADAKRQLARMIALRDGAPHDDTMGDHLARGTVAEASGRYAEAVEAYRAAFAKTGGKQPKTYVQSATACAIAAARTIEDDRLREDFLRQALIWARWTFEAARANLSDNRKFIGVAQLVQLAVSSAFAPVRDAPRTLLMPPELDREWDEFWAAVRSDLHELARQ